MPTPPSSNKNPRIAPQTAARTPSPAPAPVDAPGKTRDLLHAAPALELPKGGGAIRGMGEKFQANPVTGSASFSVPLSLSPGRNGFTPALSLSYDSGSGNGIFGVGWSLSLPMVQRRSDKHLPQYNDTDTFILSEAEDLVPLDSRSVTENALTYTVNRYQPRVEAAFLRIERWVRADGDTHWRTWSPQNVRRLFGFSSNARLRDPVNAKKVFAWYLEEERDELGNLVAYVYEDNSNDAPAIGLAEQRRNPVYRYLKRVRYANVTPETLDDGWYLELVLDYGEHTEDGLNPDSGLSVPRRQDPFSRFRTGFDVRCARLCRRALLFHRFPTGAEEEAVLTRLTTFTYDENAVATTLTAITHTGRNPEGDALSLPAITFSYTVASAASAPAFVTGLEDLPHGIDFSRAQWVDLDGEGMSGLLAEGGGSWWYKRNEGAGKLSAFRSLPSHPSPALGAGQLMDLDGDGRLEMVVRAPGMNGFFGRTAVNGWELFKPFPNRVLPQGRHLDLDGDGIPEILVPTANGLVWYPSLGKQGWGAPRINPRPPNEALGPTVLYATDQETVFLADMSGDGLVDVVRVRHSNICYWPNLGFGRFGHQIQMSHAPYLARPECFDPRRVRLVDVDGTGPADLVYVGPKTVQWWPNHAGNGFGSARTIQGVPGVDDPVTVSFADMTGDGTSCLVWASPLGRDRYAPLRYIRLMQEGKPFLLKTITNNLGRSTTLSYTASTAYFLADRRAGSLWTTKLPFPVHCLSQVEVQDAVTGWRCVSTYTYHHGYYDGVEREFRGFGRVEQRDAETIGEGAGVFAQPPVLTKSWFHTGAWKGKTNLEARFQSEWWSDSTSLPLASTMPTGLSPTEEREAHRALKGRPLRVEVYAEDGSADASKPYQMVTSRYAVTRISAHIFRVDARESFVQHTERGSDVRIAHTLVLRVGAYGAVERTAMVAYGRSSGDAAQTNTKILVEENQFLHDPDEDARWHVNVPVRNQGWELGGLSLGALTTVSALNTAFDDEDTTILDWGEAIPESGTWKQRLTDTWRSYEDDAGDEQLPSDGTWILGARVLLHQSYARAFSANQLTDSSAFDSLVSESALTDAGYVQLSGDTGWWLRSGTMTGLTPFL